MYIHTYVIILKYRYPNEELAHLSEQLPQTFQVTIIFNIFILTTVKFSTLCLYITVGTTGQYSIDDYGN